MREVNIGDKTIRLRGTTLSLLYYQQEFNRDLVGDLAGMIASMVGLGALQGDKVAAENINFGAIDSVSLLRLVWVLARTAVGPTGQFPSFTQWLAENEDIDIFGGGLLPAAIEEASNAFFRSRPGVAPAAKRR